MKTDVTLGAKGTSMLIVETKDLAGYRVGRFLDKIGQHAQDTSELFFDGVRVPRTACSAAEGPWLRAADGRPALRAHDRRRAGGGGDGGRTLRRRLRYVKGAQGLRQDVCWSSRTRVSSLAEAATITRVARTFIDRCIPEVLDGKLDEVTASMAKWWATDMQHRVIDECVQLHGGYGYMNEYLVARMYADARVTRIYGGTNEIMKELIARSF